MNCHPAGRNGDLLIWKDDVLATLYRQETLDSDLASRVDASASHTPVFTCP